MIPNSNKIKGFTMAEALVMLLISSLILMATLPVITKKIRHRLDYKFGPPGGWPCEVSHTRACVFNPPAKSKNFTIFFDDSKVPSFSIPYMGKISIIGERPMITEEVLVSPAEIVTKEDITEGYGETDSSWDPIKETTPMPEKDIVTSTQIQKEAVYKTVVIDPGGCGSVPELYQSFEEYTKTNVVMKGAYCTGAKKVRIVY